MRDVSTFKRFIVVKDFWKIGSACMGFSDDEDVLFRSTLSKCLLLAKSPLQVVRLTGPSSECLDIYGEYKPYTFYDDPLELIKICRTGDCPGRVNPFAKESPYNKKE